MKRQAGYAHATKHGGTWRASAALLGLVLLVAAGAAAAFQTVYKWKDAKGQIHYGDTPPPAGAQAIKGSWQPAADANAMPYELARAVRSHPVTLYTTSATPCAACDQGRTLLRTRGIPFTEKTVDNGDDQMAQRRLTGMDDLPLLSVGTRHVGGFQAAGWQEALDSASYPRRSVLPSGYRGAAARPASAPASTDAASALAGTSAAPATSAAASTIAPAAPPATASATAPAATPSGPPVRATMKVPPDIATPPGGGAPAVKF